MSQPRVEHDAGRQRFVAQTDAGEAYLAYERTGEHTLDLQHTIVPEAARGAGVGEALVRAAFDHARAHHEQIIPTCPFVSEWLRENPDAEDVLAVGG